MRAMAPSNSVIPQNHPRRAIILSSSYRPARWVMAKSKYKAHGPTARRWTGLTPGGLASFGASAPEHLLLPFVPKQDFVIVTCKHMATLTLDPKVVLTARGDRPMSLKSLEKDCCRAKSLQAENHCSGEMRYLCRLGQCQGHTSEHGLSQGDPEQGPKGFGPGAHFGTQLKFSCKLMRRKDFSLLGSRYRVVSTTLLCLIYLICPIFYFLNFQRKEPTHFSLIYIKCLKILSHRQELSVTP